MSDLSSYAADTIRDNMALDQFLGIIPGERWPRNTQSMGRQQMDSMSEDDARKMLELLYTEHEPLEQNIK